MIGSWVSILVLVEYPSEAGGDKGNVKTIRVSILVLVEYPSEDNDLCQPLRQSMFQSLFWWNILLRQGVHRLEPAGPEVSILVLVEYPSEVAATVTGLSRSVECFNPCSGGISF